MKYFSWSLVVLSTVLSSSFVVAQPTPPEAAPLAPKEIKLTLKYEDVDVIALLKKIAVEGNLELIVEDKVGGTIDEVNLNKVDPGTAVVKVAELAQLDWRLENKTYIISQKSPKASAPTVKQARRVSISFEKVDVAELLSVLATEFGVDIILEDDVKEILPLIHLSNETVEGLIEKISQAAHLTCRKEGENYFVSPKPLEAQKVG